MSAKVTLHIGQRSLKDGRGAYALILRSGQARKSGCFTIETPATPNALGARALLAGLEQIRGPARIEVRSPSLYVCSSGSRLAEWARYGWKRLDNVPDNFEDYANLQTWQGILAVIESRPLTMTWVNTSTLKPLSRMVEDDQVEVRARAAVLELAGDTAPESLAKQVALDAARTKATRPRAPRPAKSRIAPSA